MKTSTVTASPSSILALAAAAQFVVLVTLPLFVSVVLIGGLAAVGVLALAFSDYSYQPTLGRRRASAQPAEFAPEATPQPVAAQLDWTYATRSA
jgi:hypothetical protein